MAAVDNRSNDVPYFTLNNGQKMPAVGMGCWMGWESVANTAEEMCKNALKCGYRHFDTASGYHNEEAVGKAIRESDVPRGEIFVTTKLWNGCHHRVHEAFEESLAALDIGYIDLYLMHWPQAELNGKVKSIGVSNFSIKNLEILLPHCKVVPVTNQVQLHPCLPETELKAFCEVKGILLTGYSPFGSTNPLFFKDPEFQRVVAAHNVTPGQIALSWSVQRGTAVVPKSANPVRMKQNLQLVHLTQEDMSTIDAIHNKPGMHRNLFPFTFPGYAPGTVGGWTYEQLGWNWTSDGLVIEDE
ncbi:hypothetical protein EIP86_003293 [Pleurotus ostreatoroseus]|nr:hypothetical protein EIP86_003293 [Pleurotus ostreatoroseus]